MFGSKQRRIDTVTALAASRADRLQGAIKHAEIVTGQKRRLQGRHDELLNIIARAITASGDPAHLRKALIDAGFRAELEYALLDVPENSRPVRRGNTTTNGATTT